MPDGFVKYDTHFFFGGPILDGEESLFGPRHELIRRYARANRLDRTIVGSGTDGVAVVAAGKTFTDTMQALHDLGLDAARLQQAGIRLIQVGLMYPLDVVGVGELLAGIERVVVIEEKRGVIEQQLRAALYDADHRPTIVGKNDEVGRPLIPIRGELDADSLRPLLSRVLGLGAPERKLVPIADLTPTTVRRTPNYCSGCPHSRATVSPSGEIVLGGIGCHSIGLFLTQAERHYEYNVQMGGEGAPWIGASPFVGTGHIIQNLGDGTFYHSASQSVRACVDAGVDITFRLLYNGYISMTGGQDIPGTRGVAALTRELEAMGVRQTTVVSDRPGELRDLASNAVLMGEDKLQEALDDLSRQKGVTVLLHDRECALERRRRWRRGEPAPQERLVIHERVCEGCGDCGAKSNCSSLEPLDTEYGRKTRIQQSSCAVDLACLKGDCPSFAGITTDRPVQPGKKRPPVFDASILPHPEVRPQAAVYAIGIGGTGVSTANAILVQAALMEGLSTVALDQTGLAQKGGPVATHLITATDSSRLHANKVSEGRADLILAYDLIEAGQPMSVTRGNPAITALVVDTSITPTGEMVRDVWAPGPDQDLLLARLADATRSDRRVKLPARQLAESLFGDHMKANLITLGAASQSGFLPVSPEAIEAAIRLNGVEVDDSLLAFSYGRRWISDREAVERLVIRPTTDPLDRLAASDRDWLLRQVDGASITAGDRGLILRRAADLVDYADRPYAGRFLKFVAEVSAEETARAEADGRLTSSVAHNLHKLMAYKDEYEVARLYLDPDWRQRVRDDFGPDARITYYFHPPALRARGLRRKLRLGAWFDVALRAMRACRRLRGTTFDPFGRTELRRLERSLPDWYRRAVRRALQIAPESVSLACDVANMPDKIRGYEDIKIGNIRRTMDEAEALLGQPSSVR
jgi:indolepyruvate ferredoxin oxidoreductase